MLPEKIGSYEIVERIGAGGMGTVYLARHATTGQLAAVKVLTPALAQDAEFVERFGREVGVLTQLENPHIVRVYESGAEAGQYYYAMEYIPGETLMSLLRRERRLPWQQAIEISVQICQALKAAHDAGVIHRDLKPSNLLITQEGKVVLTDFGVAQVFAGSRLTVTGGVVGTAEYMSPEQGQGRRVTRQSDLYSLGAVLYTMVAGRPPFTGSTVVEVIQKHNYALFDRPGLYADGLPARVEEAICRLLEKDPARRFPDAFVLLRHLQKLLRLDDKPANQPDSVTITGFEEAADGDSTVAASPTVVTGQAERRGPGPATLMKGMLTAELTSMARGNAVSRFFDNIYVLLSLLALLIAGGIWFFWPKAVDAEALFAQGEALMRQTPGPHYLRARTQYFEPLLALGEPEWKERVAPYLAQIELYQEARQRRVRGQPGRQADESEPQRLFRLALHYRQIGELDHARTLLTDLETVLDGDEDHARLRSMISALLAQLQEDQEKARRQHELISRVNQRASALESEGRSEEAKNLRNALKRLYPSLDANAR
jgi:serine/threonine-protein kinase